MKKNLILFCALLDLMFRPTAFAAETNVPSEEAAPEKGKTYAPMAYPTNVHVETNVPYLGVGRLETADIYSPLEMPKDKRLPALLIMHGGGFNDGDKARPREINFCTNLVSQGYVCMSINYKLRKNAGDVTWPQSVYDAKTAVRWLRKNADKLGIDPNRIGAMGGSAGGNLAAMLALTQPKDGFDLKEPYGEFSSAVSCGVDFYGAVKLMDYHDMKMFNQTRAEAPELYIKGSPVTYAHKNAAPMLIVHGTADATVPVTQSEALADALEKAGAVHELVIVSGAAHTFGLQPKQLDLRPQVFQFFEKYLKGGETLPTMFTNKTTMP
jgi:acetyl esterase/lipase